MEGGEELCRKLVRSEAPAGSAIIYQGELDFISRCILDYPASETGGELFGFWTAEGVPVVLYAIGPGDGANHETAFFNQDVKYLTETGTALVSKYGLQHIGEWHSHHRLGLAHPSGHDAATVSNGIARQNLGRFLLCIGICNDSGTALNAFNFSQEAGLDYVQSAWDVKCGESPYRSAADSDGDLAKILRFPRTLKPQHIGKRITGEGTLRRVISREGSAGHWLEEKENHRELKQIVNVLAEMSDGGACNVQMDEAGAVHLSFAKGGDDVRIMLPERFPREPPTATRAGMEMITDGVAWDCGTGIADAFAGYAAQLDFGGGNRNEQAEA